MSRSSHLPTGSAAADSPLAAAILLSAGLHVFLAGLLLFLLPHLTAGRRSDLEEIITVQLLGGLSPQAPAAPAAPVDPNVKAPDVVEAPRSDPALNQPAPPEPALTPPTPAEVIPLGPKAPDQPPAIKRTSAPPPQLTPPKVAAEPPPKPRTPPNNEAEINRRLAELRRKREAAERDAAIDSRLYDLMKRQGAGRGESSEEYGGAAAGQTVPPEYRAYYEQIKSIINSNWRLPSGNMAGLAAVFAIKIEPDGRISDFRIERSSGNQEYDASVERAINQSTLPPLPPIFGGRYHVAGLNFDPSKQ